MFIVKLDDVNGCMKMYKNIVDGMYYMELGILELFNVIIKEICVLVIDMELDEV